MANLMDKTIEPYLFSYELNRNHFHAHMRTNTTSKNRLNTAFFEMFTQSCTPSFSGFDNEGNYAFVLPEVENYDAIREMHQGIVDFCDEYYETFQNDPYMYLISGYDAYLPFRMAIRSLGYFSNNFGNFSFPQVIGNQEEQEETIASLIRKQ